MAKTIIRKEQREGESVSFVGKGVESSLASLSEEEESNVRKWKSVSIQLGAAGAVIVETASSCPKLSSSPTTDGLARHAFPQSRNLAIAFRVIWKRTESRRCDDGALARIGLLLPLFFLFHLLRFFLLLLLPPETNSPETAETARGQLVSQSDVCHPIRLTRGALVNGISVAASMRTGVTLRGGAGER